MDEARAPAATSTATTTAAQKTLASIVKTMQPIIVRKSDDDVAATGGRSLMSKTNEASSKVNVTNTRVAIKGKLFVKVSAEKNRESAVTRFKEGFSDV